MWGKKGFAQATENFECILRFIVIKHRKFMAIFLSAYRMDIYSTYMYINIMIHCIF